MEQLNNRFSLQWPARFGLKHLMLLTILMGLSVFSYAQTTVQGKVTDDSQEPLIGLTVKVKGESKMTLTDKDGNYKITAPNGNSVLVFSYIGHLSQEIQINNRSIINVKLKPSTKDLQEVVVIGYGEVLRKDLTGAVGEVAVEDLAKAPVASIEQALAGRIAGVQVSSNQGQPGEEGINIQIRGTGSLTQDTAPLYVIDGFPIEDPLLASINPDDIASMNVLKDASATAIYGARGANGVIVIETKKGKIGKPVINYSGSFGFQEVTKRMDLLSPYEFVKVENERDATTAQSVYFSGGNTLESYAGLQGIDWQNQFFKKGATNIHSLSLRGGSRETKYSFSGSLFGTDAVVENTGFNKRQFRIAVDQVISKKLKGGIILNYNNQRSHGQYTSSIDDGLASSALLYSVWGYRPITAGLSGVDDDTDLEEDLFDGDVTDVNDYRINPILSAKNTYRTRGIDNLSGNTFLSYDLSKNLVLKVTGGLNINTTINEVFYNSFTRNGSSLRATNVYGQWGNTNNFRKTNWSNENTLTYTHRFSKKKVLTMLGGISFQENTSKGSGFTAIKVPDETLGISGLGKGTPLASTSFETVNTLQSYFTRVNYNHNSRYLFTATFRADGSSKFSTENKWGYFPSAAIAWRMSEENFMKKIRVINDAKLRLSYGSTGNNRVADFPYLSPISQDNSIGYSYGNNLPVTAAMPGAGNADLRWEVSTQINAGYDIELFKSRVQFTADIYRKNTNDLLLNATMPPSSGFTRAIKNIGKIRNEGLEFSLNTVNIQSKKFVWQSNINISFNRNEVLQLADGETRLLTKVTPRWQTGFADPALYIAAVGESAAQFVGYIFDGIYQYEDFEKLPNGGYLLRNEISTNGTPRENIKPGDIRYRDLNNDGIVNASDQTIIGRGMPKHFGGFSNSFSYKGLMLNVFFQWSYGNDVYNANRMVFEGNPSVRLNQFASYADRWSPTNPSNTLFRIGGQGPGGYYNSRVLEDASYLRLKTISMDYNIPGNKYFQKLKVSNIALTVSAQNLLTWTDYTGMDPEVSTRNTPLTPGFDYSAYPNAKTIVFGIKATL